ncbi:ABC transporter permease [Pelagibacteraceae bacterium]|nr:ABC transporter permease [Pelagibacteraceae bacterium]
MSTKSKSIHTKNHFNQDDRLKKVSGLRILLNRPELGALGGAILVFIFFGVVAGDTGMFSAFGMLNFFDVSANLGIIAIAAAMLMIGGEFDLSIGSMIGFAGICIAIPAIYWGWPLWMSIIFAFAMAVIIGYFNGLLVVKTGLPSFIVTLAMLFILRGATLAITRLITGRTQVPGLRVLIENDPLAWVFATDTFKWFFVWLGSMNLIDLRTDGTPLATGIPPSIVWFIFLTILATWILTKTRYGNWIFASGGDKNGATNVGVPVGRVKIGLFIGTAVASTIFATIQVLDAGSADTMRGSLKELEAIAAAVVGGCLLTGGYGSAIGAAFGAIIFGTVSMGIFYTDVDTDWFKVFLGVMMLIAVIFNNFIRKKVTESK